jgi:hypothetical protein
MYLCSRVKATTISSWIDHQHADMFRGCYSIDTTVARLLVISSADIAFWSCPACHVTDEINPTGAPSKVSPWWQSISTSALARPFPLLAG